MPYEKRNGQSEKDGWGVRGREMASIAAKVTITEIYCVLNPASGAQPHTSYSF